MPPMGPPGRRNDFKSPKMPKRHLQEFLNIWAKTSSS